MVLLINLKEFQNLSLLGDNADQRKLGKAVLDVQELELKPLVGETTYQLLLDQVAGNSLTNENALLLQRMKNFLVNGSMVFYIQSLHYRLTNNGIQVSSGANSSAAADGMVASLIKQYRSRMDGAKRELIGYINRDNNPDTNAINNQNTTGSSGVYLGDDIRVDLYGQAKRRAAKY